MRRLLVTLCVGLLIGLGFGCSDSDSNVTIDDSGWVLTLDLGQYQPSPPLYPVSLTLTAHLEKLVSGSNAPDGTVVVFRTSGGNFENGQQEFTTTTVGGDAVATLTIDGEGSYELSVEFGEELATVAVLFTSGG